MEIETTTTSPRVETTGAEPEEGKGVLFHTMGSTPYKMERVGERRREMLEKLATVLVDGRGPTLPRYYKLENAITALVDDCIRDGADEAEDVVARLVHTEARNDVVVDLDPFCAEAAKAVLQTIARGAKRLREQEEGVPTEDAPPAKKARGEELGERLVAAPNGVQFRGVHGIDEPAGSVNAYIDAVGETTRSFMDTTNMPIGTEMHLDFSMKTTGEGARTLMEGSLCVAHQVPVADPNPFPLVTDAEYRDTAMGYMKYKIVALALSRGVDPMAMFTPSITAKMNTMVEVIAKLDRDLLLGAEEKEKKEDKDAMEVEHVLVSDGAQSDFVRMADLFATSAEPAASKDPDFVAATPDDELPPLIDDEEGEKLNE